MDHRLGTCSACKASWRIPANFPADRARCRQCGGVVEIGPVRNESGQREGKSQQDAVAATVSAMRPTESQTTAKALNLSPPAPAPAPAPTPAPAPAPVAAKPAAPPAAKPAVARPAAPAPRRSAPPPPPPSSKAVPIAIGSLAALALAALGWFFFVREKPTGASDDSNSQVEAKEPEAKEPAPAGASATPESAPAEH